MTGYFSMGFLSSMYLTSEVVLNFYHRTRKLFE
jgi:hypothetical protein